MLNAAQIVFVLKLVLEMAEALQCHGPTSSQFLNCLGSLQKFCTSVPFTGDPPSNFYPEESREFVGVLEDTMRVLDADS